MSRAAPAVPSARWCTVGFDPGLIESIVKCRLKTVTRSNGHAARGMSVPVRKMLMIAIAMAGDQPFPASAAASIAGCSISAAQECLSSLCDDGLIEVVRMEQRSWVYRVNREGVEAICDSESLWKQVRSRRSKRPARAKGMSVVRASTGSALKVNIEINGRVMGMSDWAKERGMHVSTIHRRLCMGWPPEQAVMTPPAKPGSNGRKKFAARSSD